MSDQIVGLRECWLSNLSDICRTFWEEYVGPESLIVDTLGVYCTLLYTRDVNRFWSSRQIDADHAVKRSKLGALYRSSGINGAKSCILGLSWHLISLLKLHFFVLFFSYIFFYIFLIICITLYSLLYEKAVQWTLFTSLFALSRHSVFDKGAPV
jgi:hypothetical protein